MAFTASAHTPTGSTAVTNNNSAHRALRAATNYQVILALVGADTTTDGWSVGRSTPSSGVLTVTAGQVISVTVPLVNWPANFDKAAFVSVMLAVGSGGFQPVMDVPIDSLFTSRNFEILIDHEPLTTVTQYSMATLMSTSNNGQKGLGDRAPVGFTFSSITPTTDSSNIRHLVGNSVTFKPNTSNDYTLIGSRPAGVDFKTMLNDIGTVVQASAGNYTSTTLGSGTVIKQASQGLLSANVFNKGNQPLIFVTAPDPETGTSDVLLFTSLLLQNTVELALAWSKNDQTPVTWNFTTVPNDYYNIDKETLFSYNVK